MATKTTRRSDGRNSTSDETAIRVQYANVLAKVVPEVPWDYASRTDLRRLLKAELRMLQSRFTPGEMDRFLEDYNAWNCGIVEDLSHPASFLEKASHLGTARCLALRLLLMERQFPLEPIEDSVDEKEVPF